MFLRECFHCNHVGFVRFFKIDASKFELRRLLGNLVGVRANPVIAGQFERGQY